MERWCNKNREIVIEGCDPEALNMVLDYMYGIDLPNTFQLLEYQWWEGKFDTLGKLVSAHRADGLPPYMGGVPSERGVAAGAPPAPLPPPLTAQMGPPHTWGGPICTVCRDQFP